jgi:hypothetical protein
MLEASVRTYHPMQITHCTCGPDWRLSVVLLHSTGGERGNGWAEGMMLARAGHARRSSSPQLCGSSTRSGLAGL